MDLLFERYASPFLLLDNLIPSGRLNDFIETLEEVKQEEEMWEFYIHKLPAWDDRTYDEFKKEINGGIKTQERPSDEQLETIIGNSYDTLKNFRI